MLSKMEIRIFDSVTEMYNWLVVSILFAIESVVKVLTSVSIGTNADSGVK